MKRLLSLLTVFCLCLAIVAPSQSNAAILKLSKAKATLEVDSTLKLKLGKLDGSESKWTTDSKKIATVSKEGIVTAKSEGTVIITATYKGNKYTCSVTVVNSNKSFADNTKGKLSDYVKVINEYRWSNDFFYYVAFVVKNTSSSTVEATLTVKLLDENGKSVGANNDTIYTIGTGEEVLFVFLNEESFDSCQYSLSAKKDTMFSSVFKSLAVVTNTVGDKAIIEITNNGDVAAEFVKYDILYFLDGKVVADGWGFCIDSDKEIKPGNTEINEDKAFTEFDSIKVFVTGKTNK